MISCFKKKRDLNIANENTPLFSLKGRLTNAKCVKFRDPNNIHLVFVFYKKLVRWKCKIINISELSKLATPLKILILNQIIYIKCFDFDKNGKLKVYVYLK